jgi:prevent-host-death family protein
MQSNRQVQDVAMDVVSIHEAKAQFSRLLRRVAAGQEITITNRGVPVARLIPVSAPQPARKLGILSDTLKIADDFDSPLPDEILDLFEAGNQAKKNEIMKYLWTSDYLPTIRSLSVLHSERSLRLRFSKTLNNARSIAAVQVYLERGSLSIPRWCAMQPSAVVPFSPTDKRR